MADAITDWEDDLRYLYDTYYVGHFNFAGSAGWMQRAGIESILGLRLRGEVLHLDPCIPKSWPGFEMLVGYRSARYKILVENPDGAGRGIASAQLDDTVIVERPLRVPLADDGVTHQLRVRLG